MKINSYEFHSVFTGFQFHGNFRNLFSRYFHSIFIAYDCFHGFFIGLFFSCETVFMGHFTGFLPFHGNFMGKKPTSVCLTDIYLLWRYLHLFPLQEKLDGYLQFIKAELEKQAKSNPDRFKKLRTHAQWRAYPPSPVIFLVIIEEGLVARFASLRLKSEDATVLRSGA